VHVAMATSASAPGRVNEDFVGAVPGAVVLLDGAGIPGTESICQHGVAWYTHRLGGTLLGRLPAASGQDLRGVIADSIGQIAGEHRRTCDITNPSSPQATVMVFRVDEREVAVRRQCSEVLSGVAKGTPEYDRALQAYIDAVRSRRNQPGGYWIAKDDPDAAAQALTGSTPVSDLTGVALLSNGASRIVDPYGLADWPDVVGLLRAKGPAEIIHRVRDAEADGSRAGFQPLAKAADDATAAYCTSFG